MIQWAAESFDTLLVLSCPSILLGKAGQWPTSLPVPNDTGSDMRAASELATKPQGNHAVHCEWLHHSSRTVSCIHYMLCLESTLGI